jgi:hypothetical protein
MNVSVRSTIVKHRPKPALLVQENRTKGVIQTGTHTCSFQILNKNKKYISYITLDNFSFQLCNSWCVNVFFKNSTSIRHNARYLSRSWLVSYAWERRIEFSSPLNIIFFHVATMLLFCTIQRITFRMFCIFPKICNHASLYGLFQAALMSIQPHRFVCPPCWYYQL